MLCRSILSYPPFPFRKGYLRVPIFSVPHHRTIKETNKFKADAGEKTVYLMAGAALMTPGGGAAAGDLGLRHRTTSRQFLGILVRHKLQVIYEKSYGVLIEHASFRISTAQTAVDSAWYVCVRTLSLPNGLRPPSRRTGRRSSSMRARRVSLS